MNGDRSVRDDIQSYIDKALYMQFNEGYHEGRHVERKKLLKSGWLQIKDIDEVRQAALSPCSNCEHRCSETKMPCLKKDSCKKLERQFLALEILNYFD